MIAIRIAPLLLPASMQPDTNRQVDSLPETVCMQYYVYYSMPYRTKSQRNDYPHFLRVAIFTIKAHHSRFCLRLEEAEEISVGVTIFQTRTSAFMVMDLRKG